MKKWTLVLLLLLPLSSTFAAELAPKQMVENFFDLVVKDQVSNGYDQLFTGSSIPKDKPQAVSMLKQQTQSGLPLYGKVLGYEYISEEKFGTSVIRYVYILKSEKGPTVWEFYFYKPKGSWFLANVMFNDQFTLLR
jgi:hypothetical protein